MAKIQVISTLTQTALLAFQDGDPNPAVPAGLTSKLAYLVQQGTKVLVIETSHNWLAVLHARKQDEGLVMAYAYKRNEAGTWHEEPFVIDQELKCMAFFGGPVLSLDGLAEISDRLRSWVNEQRV